MLIEFRVANHRSVREEQVLTLEAGRGGDSSDRRPRVVDGHAEPLLPVAALFGANASGKSNVLAALAFMRDAVVHSHRAWAPDGGVPREPFAWGPQAPSTFEVTWIRAAVRYQYGFVADDARFVEEWLYAWPSGRRQVWFERDGDDFKFGEHLRGENRVVEQVTRPNGLFLSAAVQNRHQQLGEVFAWFRSMGAVNVRTRRYPGDQGELWLERALRADGARQASMFAGEPPPDEGVLAAFKDLLRASDFGIEDVKAVEGPERDLPDRPPFRRSRILVKHRGGDGDRGWLPLDEESQGTRTMFRVGPPAIDTLRRGGLLVVDELEASLHPLLGLHIVRLFNDPSTNPRNAQLVFATHDTNLLGTLLGPPPLRRDQVWLTEKDEQGETRIYPLTDYKPRKAENLESGYLQGRYGAIPFLGALATLPE
ncbi:MAG: ATP-binding protein [Myxococcota bacterium]